MFSSSFKIKMSFSTLGFTVFAFLPSCAIFAQNLGCNNVITVLHNCASSSCQGLTIQSGVLHDRWRTFLILWLKHMTCNLSSMPHDCQDVQRLGYRQTGVYTIYRTNGSSFKVRCDMETDGGGWTVIQRRESDSDFYKTWQEYKVGFGDLNTNFWLGNEKIYALTASGRYKLRVDLTNMDGVSLYAEYASFSVSDEHSKYILSISGYSGTAGYSLAYHDNATFSIKDNDNDEYLEGSCAAIDRGAWWFRCCYHSNLNGAFKGAGDGVRWLEWSGNQNFLSKTEMKIRRN